MTDQTADSVEVAIAGGGPVALCLALILAERGIDVCVLERDAELSQDLRASTFHPPTLDMLDTLGLGEKVVSGGLICPEWQVRMHPSGERAVFDLSVLAADTAHPYRLQYEQWRLSQLLLKRLQALPSAEVRFGHRVTGVDQGESHALLRAVGPKGTVTLRAPLVVGADGARSAVRGALGLSFDGMTYPETTLLATTTFPFEDHLEGLSNVSYCWKDGGNFSLLKVPGRWRVSIYPREDRPLDEQTAPEAIDAALREIVPIGDQYGVGETRPYRVHQRIVPSYVAGRIALAGDAAHVNAPSGGMGMNGGVHDAFELADALIDILRNGASLDRLGLYERRRRPVAREQILAQADRNRARMREKDPQKRREILEDLQTITRDRERLFAYVLRSSMIEGLRQARLVA